MLLEYSYDNCFFDPFSLFFHVPFDKTLPMINEKDSGFEMLSAFFHEVTHFDCMDTDFGMLLLAQVFDLKRKINKGIFLEDGTPIEEIIPRKSDNPFEVSFKLWSTSLLSNLGAAMPILEGLAMYFQLDYIPSKKYDTSPMQFGLASFFLSNLNKPNRVPDVMNFFDELREYNHLNKRIFESLHFQTDRSNSFYLYGYIFIKSLQAILIERDQRLSDNEVFYVFIRNYFFNGYDFYNCKNIKPAMFLLIYQKRVELIKNCHPVLIKEIVNILAQETDAKDYNLIDIFAVLNEKDTEDEIIRPPKHFTATNICVNLKLDLDDYINFLRASQLLTIKHRTSKVIWLNKKNIRDNADYIPTVTFELSSGTIQLQYLPIIKARKLVTLVEESGFKLLKYYDFTKNEEIANRISREREEFMNLYEFVCLDNQSKCPVNIFSSKEFIHWDIPDQISINRKEKLEKDLRILEQYSSIIYRNEMTQFLFDIFKKKLPYIGMFIHDFNLYIYQNFMNFKDGRQFLPFSENGYRKIGFDFPNEHIKKCGNKYYTEEMATALNSILNIKAY